MVVRDALEEASVVVLHQSAVEHHLKLAGGEGGPAKGLARGQGQTAGKKTVELVFI